MVPTPVTVQKPTYTVQRGAVTKSLRLGGRVLPVRQQDLFFRTDGYVKDVYFKRGDTVKGGDVLAELETGELANQLAEAEMAVQVAETKLIQARQENAEALIEAQLALDKANMAALQAGALGAVNTLEEAQANVERYEQRFRNTAAIYEDAQANRRLSDFEKEKIKKSYEDARRLLENAKALLEAEENLAAVLAGLETARAVYEQAQADPELSGEAKDAAFQAFEAATAAYVDAWIAYGRTLGGKFPLGYEARKAGLDAALAKMKVEKLKRGPDPMLALDVEKARLSLQVNQEKVSNTRLVAPFDGEILSFNLTPGSQVTAFRAVLTLADPAALEITAIPTPEELADLGVGQAAVVRLSAQPGKEFAARVRSLPILSGTDPEEETGDQAVRINLEDPSVALTLGEAATVVIQIETRADVLWLPPAAIRTFQGQDFVFIESGGVQRRVNVRLGLKSDDRVEILEGLEEGQVVVGQ
jgi:multidrug efflux pump subunit AcrA (membrane-fusion protein)